MSILGLLKDLITATIGQMASLFGGVVLVGLLIDFISRLTFGSLARSFGRKGTYFVAWLGTPIHELGHAIFCLIFAHRIIDIKFFKPDPLTGTLGYVSHTWNRSNPWQVLGNFFIGIGPILSGSVTLFAAFYFLIPESSQVWDSISLLVGKGGQDPSIGNQFAVLKGSAFVMLKLVFTLSNLTNWRFWVFSYLSICIASNIRLSLSDLKGALSGLGCVVLPFLVVNFLAIIGTSGTEKLFPFTALSLGAIYGLFVLASVMAFFGFVLTYLVSATYAQVKRRYLINRV